MQNQIEIREMTGLVKKEDWIPLRDTPTICKLCKILNRRNKVCFKNNDLEEIQARENKASPNALLVTVCTDFEYIG